VKTIDPRTKQTTQLYDGLGRVKEIKDRNNRTRTFGYDINDNLTTESWGNGIGLSFTYDKVGNLLSSTDGTSGTIDT
jgi:YD repeat-containing protein